VITPSARLGEVTRRTRLALAVLVMLLLPLVGLPREDQRASLPAELSYFYIADVALISIALLCIPALIRSVFRPRGLEGVLWSALFALLFVAFAINPSASGVDLVIRLVAGAALYLVVGDADPTWRRRIAVALGATAALQALVALLQVVTGAPLGLTALGEIDAPLRHLRHQGPALAVGTMGHEYILAALAILTAVVLSGEALRSSRPAAWLVPAAIAISSIGLIYGRTVAISFALAWGSFGQAALRDPRYRPVLVALLIGAGVTAVAFSSGWTNSFGRGLATSRTGMALQAAAIVEEQPLFGVGPGNYLETLRSRPELHTTSAIGNVHTVPALLAAEAGVPAGIVSAALLFLVGLRSLRAGPLARALFAGFFLWTILDVLPYVTPQGIVLGAVWLASIRHAERWPP
jgi:hypothetical protein